MKILIFLLLTMNSLTACSDHAVPTEPPVAGGKDTIPAVDTTNLPNPPPDTIYYLALGDSYTIGESVSYSERYPVQLTTKLRQAGLRVAEPTIIARTGWTTTQLKNAIAGATLRSRYDLVSLLIGVNNQYRGLDIEVYKTEFLELLQKAIELAGGDKRRVIVLSIPDYAYTPFGRNSSRISREIDAYNAINLSITTQLGVTYFDITPISRRGLEQPDLVASDALHPSGKMYAQWVELIYPQVLGKLK